MRGEQGDFSFVPAASPEQWQARAARVRQIMRVTMGLWPMPTRTPLNAVVHGRRDLGDYTIEKVIFESMPGFYVTGNLYRPKGREDKRPAVLSPHGHFPGGRFIDEGRDAVRRKIAAGAERFEDGGRSFMQSRCVQLARMGCVVFHYDMIGYGDSVQIPLEVAHRFSRLRVQFDEPPADGLYSAAALLRLHNPLGLHTYNSIRALDFLAGLPDVDPQRIAVTGGSGGGTQTFMLCAIDDRPRVSVPVVIVSTARQGGCTCENICGLRLGTYNLEFTALHAPKPLMLISADDATRTMGERGFPELQQHYKTLGAADAVRHVPLLHFPHNYNAVSRAAMYGWLNQHLELGLQEPILERPYQRLTREELTVWDKDHPAPEPGPQHERRLLAWLSEDAQRQLAALVPRDTESLARYREVVGGGWEVLLRGLPEDAGVRFHEVNSTRHEAYRQSLGLLRYRTMDDHRAELPVVRLVPNRGNGRTVVWIDAAGKAGLYADDGSPAAHTRKLLEAGRTVIGVDLLEQGESAPADRPPGRQRWLKGEEAFAGWTYCYNLPLFAQRVHDILATIAWAAKNPRDEVHLIGLGKAGTLAAAALARAGGRVHRAAIDTRGFRFADLTDVYDADFLPGAVRYGDVPALLALAAPTELWVAGEQDANLAIAHSGYRATGKPESLVVYTGSDPQTDAVRWLLGRPVMPSNDR